MRGQLRNRGRRYVRRLCAPGHDVDDLFVRYDELDERERQALRRYVATWNVSRQALPVSSHERTDELARLLLASTRRGWVRLHAADTCAARFVALVAALFGRVVHERVQACSHARRDSLSGRLVDQLVASLTSAPVGPPALVAGRVH